MDILYLLLGSIITVIMYNLYNYWDAYERKRRDKKFEKSMDTIESMLKSDVIKHVFEFCGEDSKISKHMNKTRATEMPALSQCKTYVRNGEQKC